jgi:hypothetical protein
VSEVTCIGCGCTTSQACAGGCHWLAVDEASGEGICSNCPEFYAPFPDAEPEPPALILPGDPDYEATLRARSRR